MKYFSKLTTDNGSELFKWMVSKPLRAALLCEISARVRSTTSKIHGISKGEFVISKTEHKKFGLSQSQRNQIDRCIKDFIRFGLVSKTHTRTDTKAIVYKFIGGELWDCSRNETHTQADTKRARNKNERK